LEKAGWEVGDRLKWEVGDARGKSSKWGPCRGRKFKVGDGLRKLGNWGTRPGLIADVTVKVPGEAPLAQRHILQTLGRAGLEAPWPRRPRGAAPAGQKKFELFTARKRKIPLQNVAPHILSQGSPKALILKLRIKATLEFWTFQPPLRRPGLQATHIRWGRAERERERHA